MSTPPKVLSAGPDASIPCRVFMHAHLIGASIIFTLPLARTQVSVKYLLANIKKVTLMQVRQSIMQMVRAELGDEVNKSGAVLYNGYDTLQEGEAYIMGLNPGG